LHYYNCPESKKFKAMRICIAIKRLSQTWGGAERVAVNLCKRLLELGHEVHVVTSYSDLQIEGLNTKIIKENKVLSPLKILSFQRKFKKIIDKQNYDIIYGLCQVYPVDIYRVGGGIHSHWMRLQYPNTIMRWIKYSTSLVHLAMVWIENQIFKEGNCRLFITNSRLIKNQIIEYFQISEERIKVIYNGVDHELFNPDVKRDRSIMREKYGINDDEFVLLFVANNWERKGLSTIIRAMAKTSIEKIRLIVVGRGKKSTYLSIAKKNNITEDKISFVGQRSDVERFYGMADVFILPTMYEPFANVCLEAMACGLPVITTITNGASELISDEFNGFVLNEWQDYKRLSEIIDLLKDRQIREKIANNAAETAKDFTWQRHIEETNRVFESLQK
jgi:UDP-glucose:(heptosyl)LPS alpha-1,3-glucosyltransferase